MKLSIRNTLLLTILGISQLLLPLSAQTIAEKKAGIGSGSSELSPEMQKFLVEINKELKERQEDLARFQAQVLDLYNKNAPPEMYREVLIQINEVKENIRILQESWREMATKSGAHDEGYALWHAPDTNLEQLIMDYGSLEYVYLITPEIGSIEVSVASNIPIPKASWGEMLEQILLQNGVGIKILNPYLRQLYFIQKDLSSLSLITANPKDLEVYPSNTRVSFVLTPEPMDVRRIWYFLEKFVDSNSTVLQRIGRAILIVGEVSSVKNLLRIYDFVTANKRELEYKAVPLFRIDAEEMAKILSAVFEELAEEATVEEGSSGQGREVKGPPRPGRPPKAPLMPSNPSNRARDINSLNVIALPKIAQAVFLIGTIEEIKKAEEIINEVERQVGDAREKSVFWYNVRHSDPEEIADVMEKIYLMMIKNRLGPSVPQEEEERIRSLQKDIENERRNDQQLRNEAIASQISHPVFFSPPYYQQGDYVVNPRPIGAIGAEKKNYNQGRENFIVDPKTGSLVMVIETDLIPKMKEVLKKLDVPKKMVQIEVMLFEKIYTRNNSYGLNLLKMGDIASGLNQSASAFGGDGTGSGVGNCLIPDFHSCVGRGIFEFFYSSKDVPMDFAYKFMMTQDNVYLNASPSVVTMNQTEATIAIKDEKSILVGTTFPDATAGVSAQDLYTRAQYGITITVTPTIHMADDEDSFADPINYVSLVSHINFDTFPPGQELSNQPTVNRREIINEVRIPDGQTVIIGGLRRKSTDDSIERIPFLGEIPGIGKLFSHTRLHDEDTELLIFMTPRIISEPERDFAKLRAEHLCLRPGDLPAFLCRLNQALECENQRVFRGFMEILFGRKQPRYICPEVEYDGR